jgi:hypothetical protein
VQLASKGASLTNKLVQREETHGKNIDTTNFQLSLTMPARNDSLFKARLDALSDLSEVLNNRRPTSSPSFTCTDTAS